MWDIQQTAKQAPEKGEGWGKESIRECLEIFPQLGKPKEGLAGEVNHLPRSCCMSIVDITEITARARAGVHGTCYKSDLTRFF